RLGVSLGGGRDDQRHRPCLHAGLAGVRGCDRPSGRSRRAAVRVLRRRPATALLTRRRVCSAAFAHTFGGDIEPIRSADSRRWTAMGYVPTAWASFWGALAAIAGALTGLLFVALSVKGAALSKSPALRFRAAQTLVLFVTSVMIAIVLVAPQPATAVGW